MYPQAKLIQRASQTSLHKTQKRKLAERLKRERDKKRMAKEMRAAAERFFQGEDN